MAAKMNSPFSPSAMAIDAGAPTVRPETLSEFLDLAAVLMRSPLMVLASIDGDEIAPLCTHGIAMHSLHHGGALRNFLQSRMATRLVEDALKDPRLSTDPLVVNEPYVRAGLFAPIAAGTNPRAFVICALSPVPSAFDREALTQIDALASLLGPILARQDRGSEEPPAQTGLAEVQEFYSLAERAAGIGCWHINLDDRSALLSAEAARMIGLQAEVTLPLASLLRRWPPQIRRLLRQAARNTLHGHAPFVVEAGLMKGEQDARPFRLIGNAAIDAHRGRCITGMMLDPLSLAGGAVQSRVEQRDALTGLHNRVAFDTALCAALGSASEIPVTIALMDLDGFKQVNDTFGHVLGDRVLVAISDRLRRHSAKLSRIARWGGDEFALLFRPDTPIEAARLLVSELLDDLANLSVRERDTLPLGASCGIVELAAPMHIEEAMGRADLALYHAKASGRGRVSVWREEMSASQTARKKSVIQLQAALDEQRTFPVYQPIVDLASGRITGLEALLRLDDGSGVVIEARHVHPADFNRHLAHAVSKKMIADIASECDRLRVLLGDDYEVAINLSEADLRSSNLAGILSQAIARTALEPRNLAIEVSESVLLRDYAGTARNVLRHLDELGFMISLDDFGTGSCSLTQLRDFPISKVKIDQGLIARIGLDHQSRLMTAAIVQMSHSLGLKVVAEGVEDDVQEQFLRAIGCDLAQGFRFGRPASLAQIERDVARHNPQLLAPERTSRAN